MDSWPSPTPARLVGRDTELGHLDAALDVLDDGGPAYVALEGEPGIGKTRLLDELRARAQARGHVVLSGVAAEFEREMPFSVWVDALDEYVRTQDFARHEGWDEGLAAELGQVLPSLRAAAGGDGALPDERFRVHRAVSRLLGLVADEKPLLLVLDDLQWSDAASVELIAALARRAPDAPVLMALGFRPGQAALRLTAALTGPRARRMELVELSEAESALLLEHLDKDAAAAIYRQGGGNPFYLEQLGRMDGAGAPAAEPATDGAGVPAAVAGAIAAELGSLPERARRLLGAAAVAGEPFDLDLAVAISDVEPGEALAALDELLDADLVRPTQVPRRFVFRHPLVRGAVYRGLRGRPPAGGPCQGCRGTGRPRGGPGRAGASRRAVRRHGRRGGDRGAAGGGRGRRRPRPGRGGALVRSGAAAGSGRGQRPTGVRAGVARFGAAAWGSSSAAARHWSRRWSCFPRVGRPAGRDDHVCAAVEHWLGRHEEAHRRLVRGVGGGRGPLDCGRGGAADRARAWTASTSSTHEQTVCHGLRSARDRARRSEIAR